MNLNSRKLYVYIRIIASFPPFGTHLHFLIEKFILKIRSSRKLLVLCNKLFVCYIKWCMISWFDCEKLGLLYIIIQFINYLTYVS